MRLTVAIEDPRARERRLMGMEVSAGEGGARSGRLEVPPFDCCAWRLCIAAGLTAAAPLHGFTPAFMLPLPCHSACTLPALTAARAG